MNVDLSEIFAKYEALVADVDAVFNRVAETHPECVTCEKGCSECCHALFDLSLVEAMYINHRFGEAFDFSELPSNILDRADEADRQAYKLKRQAYRKSRDGAETREILEEMARQRIRCPLLDEDDNCQMYQYRPITCRLYGIPTAIGGKAHTCGKAKFEKGEAYPTVSMDRIQDKLIALSQEIVDTVESRFKELSGVYVPLSMALLTNYDKKYLGIGKKEKEGEK